MSDISLMRGGLFKTALPLWFNQQGTVKGRLVNPTPTMNNVNIRMPDEGNCRDA